MDGVENGHGRWREEHVENRKEEIQVEGGRDRLYTGPYDCVESSLTRRQGVWPPHTCTCKCLKQSDETKCMLILLKKQRENFCGIELFTGKKAIIHFSLSNSNYLWFPTSLLSQGVLPVLQVVLQVVRK